MGLDQAGLDTDTNLDPFTIGEWTKFEMSSTFVDNCDIPVFEVKVNGVKVLEKNNTDVVEVSEMFVFAGSPSYAPIDGLIKDLFVSA